LVRPATLSGLGVCPLTKLGTFSPTPTTGAQ
jgi:hypothetical protein